MKRAHTEDFYTTDTEKDVLHVKPILKYQKTFPYFRQPTEFGCFSLDGKRQFCDDAHQLKYYDPPKSLTKLNYDLRDGYDTCIQKDDDIKERLSHLLRWISKHRNKFASEQDKLTEEKTRLNTDFVAWRGHFTKFICSPYENREPWRMAATLFNGTIFISEVETEKACKDRKNRPPHQQEMCYWGYRFEGYVTKPMKNSECQDEGKVTNTNEAYCTIVRTRLSKHSILMGAEVDCCQKDSTAKPPGNYIELKTTRHMQHYKQRMNFARFKLLKFWAQSFLAGLPTIVVGLRDDDGLVHDLKTYKTLEIPSHCKEFSNHWEPNICMNFLDEFLSWLKCVVVLDNKNVVYMFNFEHPFDKVSVELISDGSERFLPEWFTDGVES